MSDKIFDDLFLARLGLVMAAIAQESADANDSAPLQSEDYEAIYAAYAESGGDPTAAKEKLAGARQECDQALGRVLQYVADQYGAGAVERLERRALADIARDAFDATENWLDDVELRGPVATPLKPLQILLEAHYRLKEALLAMHDQILWPIARRIGPGD